VVRPLEDRQARLDASLKSVVAVWQTPPPIAGSTRLPMIICPSRKPRSAVRGPTTSLKREHLAGLDDRPVDEVATVDVVDPVRRRRAHLRREGVSWVVDPELLRLLRRQVGRDGRERERRWRAPLGAAAAARMNARRRGRRLGSVRTRPRSRRLPVDDEAGVARTLAPRSGGARRTRASRWLVEADWKRPLLGVSEQAPSRSAPIVSDGLAGVEEVDRRGEVGAHLRRGCLRRGVATSAGQHVARCHLRRSVGDRAAERAEERPGVIARWGCATDLRHAIRPMASRWRGCRDVVADFAVTPASPAACRRESSAALDADFIAVQR